MKLDTDKQIFFYEQEFYVLSNFSAFRLDWAGLTFDTSEAAYHWNKFPDHIGLRDAILHAPSAHLAFKIAEGAKEYRRPDWDAVKVDVMRNILRAKVGQHEYVRRKLLESVGRELIENSWRDDYWGWGPNRDGHNMLGRLWMEVRAELLTLAEGAAPYPDETMAGGLAMDAWIKDRGPLPSMDDCRRAGADCEFPLCDCSAVNTKGTA